MGHGDSVDTARVETLLKAPQDSFFCVVYMRVYSHIKSLVLYQPDAIFKLCPHSKSQRVVQN